jgi:uncharacterized protein YcbX
LYKRGVITVSALYIYPIKSCRGISVQGCRLDALGPYLDRRFMLIDERGVYITQRTEPRLARVAVSIHPTAFSVSASGMRALKLPLSQRDDGASIEVEVWEYNGPALDAGAEAGEWFSEFLGRPCRLVRCDMTQTRRVDPEYAPEPAYTAFSDGFPELLLSQASLDDLGRRASQVFAVERFRPNIVLAGAQAYEEDSWQEIRIGAIPFDVVKPCARCVITTLDPVTGEGGVEPLATLATYRKQGKGVMFGQNCVHRELGTIRVGDAVSVVRLREPSQAGRGV